MFSTIRICFNVELMRFVTRYPELRGLNHFLAGTSVLSFGTPSYLLPTGK